jgi:hypothetical protein
MQYLNLDLNLIVINEYEKILQYPHLNCKLFLATPQSLRQCNTHLKKIANSLHI